MRMWDTLRSLPVRVRTQAGAQGHSVRPGRSLAPCGELVESAAVPLLIFTSAVNYSSTSHNSSFAAHIIRVWLVFSLAITYTCTLLLNQTTMWIR